MAGAKGKRAGLLGAEVGVGRDVIGHDVLRPLQKQTSHQNEAGICTDGRCLDLPTQAHVPSQSYKHHTMQALPAVFHRESTAAMLCTARLVWNVWKLAAVVLTVTSLAALGSAGCAAFWRLPPTTKQREPTQVREW